MQIAMGMKQVDGLWNSTDPITWEPYTGSYRDIDNLKLTTANIPNVNNTNEYYYPFKLGSGARDTTFYMLDEADNTWKSFSQSTISSGKTYIDRIDGIKIVTIPYAQGVKIYIAKDNTQYALIPNISQYKRTETYISDVITADNFMTYRTWNHKGSVGRHDSIILAFPAYTVGSSVSYDNLVGFSIMLDTSENQHRMFFSTDSIPFGLTTNPDTEWGLLPTITNHYYSADDAPSPTADLQARVTRLENSMADLQSRVSKLEADIKNIPQLIAWANEGVSKFYVSR